MKKAIIVIAHQKPEQLNLFFEQLLQDEETYIFVHVNKLSSGVVEGVRKDPRIIFAKNRLAVHWGSDEILQVIISLFKEIVESPHQFEYVIICTGQDMLIKGGLNAYLEKHKDQVFVDCDDRNTTYMDKYERARLLYIWPEIYRRKYDWRYHPYRILRSIHFRLLLKQPKWGKKKIRYDVSQMVFYKDNWQSGIPIAVVKYLLDFLRENPGYLDMCKNAYIPEEGFITTFVMNSPFKDRIVFNNGMSESIMLRGNEQNNHPVVFTMNDLDLLHNTDCYFARKFDIDTDRKVMEHFLELTKRC